jgi:hypothetical protein
MAEIRGQVKVYADGSGGLEVVVTCTSGDGHCPDDAIEVSRDPNPLGGGGQADPYPLDERGQGLRHLRFADAAEAAADAWSSHVAGRVGPHERRNGCEAERTGEGVRHARIRDISVGMRHIECDTAGQQCMDNPAFWCGGRHAMHAAQKERVMRDHQIGPPLDGLGGNDAHRIQGEENLLYGRLRVTADQADRIPWLRPRRLVKLLEAPDGVGKARHRRRLSRPHSPWTFRVSGGRPAQISAPPPVRAAPAWGAGGTDSRRSVHSRDRRRSARSTGVDPSRTWHPGTSPPPCRS